MTGTPPTDRLGELRREIDEIDAGIVALLDRRADAALNIGTYKSEAGMPSPLDAAREDAVIQHVQAIRRGPFPERDLIRLYRQIMAVCRGLQEK
ncbi:MAG TPA: chorismate mutase [Candidatus Ozemobacteraceae bacterium]|nr:chorismate mutase [Candidatus Ozemobacteraceae bacterium]